MFGEKMDIRMPGPSHIPPQVQRAIQETMNHPFMDYRNREFAERLLETARAARPIFQTDGEVLLLAGSGTSAIQAAAANVAGPGDTVIACVVGHFGEYAVGIARQLGLNVVVIESELGTPTDPQAVKDALDRHPDARAVFVTHNETSTGVANDLATIGEIVRDTDALLVVDAVSSAACMPVRSKDWGLDVVAVGCQKGLMTPPGLSLLAVSDKAWDVINSRQSPSFYFDLRKYRDAVTSGQTPYTPNVALVNGLRAALRMIEEEGLENTFRRHVDLRDMTRSAMAALGLPCLVTDEAAASPAVTTVVIERTDADEFREFIRRELRIAVAGGLGPLKGKIVRLAHMGYVDAGDVLKMIAAVELAMAKAGYPVELGAGVAAAQRCWLERQATRV